MRAICLEQPRSFHEIALPAPEQPGPGQALVRTHRMGICGSDISGYLGKMPFYKYPRIPGHELGVEVLAVSDDATNVRPGDRCSIEPYMNCGRCYACRKGRGNCCENLNVLGVMVDGGLREQFLVRADKLHPSKSLTFDQLALIETLAIGCHAVDRGEVGRADRLLIIGAGPIGLATLEFGRLTGAQTVIMDRVEARLDFCRKTYSGVGTLLATEPTADLQEVLRLTGGDRFSVVIDATGNAQSMANALHFVSHTGTLVYVGITSAEVTFPHPWLHRPEMTIRGSRNALPPDFPRIIGLIEDGTIDTNPWITHHTSFERFINDFESITDPATGVIKAIVDVT